MSQNFFKVSNNHVLNLGISLYTCRHNRGNRMARSNRVTLCTSLMECPLPMPWAVLLLRLSQRQVRHLQRLLRLRAILPVPPIHIFCRPDRPITTHLLQLWPMGTLLPPRTTFCSRRLELVPPNNIPNITMSLLLRDSTHMAQLQ